MIYDIYLVDSVEWGYQEPSLRINGKDCALLLHSGTNSEWSTEYCRQKHEFICHVGKWAHFFFHIKINRILKPYIHVVYDILFDFVKYYS